MAIDIVTSVNFVLSVVILAIGVLNYLKMKSVVSLYVGAGFGLFAVSHLATLAGLSDSMSSALVVIRAVGYISVIIALYAVMVAKPVPVQKKPKKG